MTSITLASQCKRLLALGCLLLSGCSSSRVKIPTCGAELVVPKGCAPRVWGNAVEFDCQDGAKVYHCTALKQPSPTAKASK